MLFVDGLNAFLKLLVEGFVIAYIVGYNCLEACRYPIFIKDSTKRISHSFSRVFAI